MNIFLRYPCFCVSAQTEIEKKELKQISKK